MQILIKTIDLIKLLGKLLKKLVTLTSKPFTGVWKFLLKPMVLYLYKNYLKIKNKVLKSPFIKNYFGFIFYNKHVVHVIIVIIAIFVASTNLLLANEVRHEDVAKKSNLYKLIRKNLDIGNNEEIVQKAQHRKPKKNYINTNSLVVATIPETIQKQNLNQSLIINKEGTTLATTNILEEKISKKRGDIVEYEVQEGDNIGLIAGKFGVSLNTLLWSNNLNKDSYIKPGQKIKIPPASGILYTVKSGDTLDDIIKKHEANKEETLKWNRDKIDENENIVVGTEILLAGGKPYTPPAPKPTVSSSYYTGSRSSYSSGSIFKPGNGSNVTGGKLNWPSVCRRISQGVRWGHIAIDINCGYNNPVYAAESGQVTVIPNKGNGYGNYVIINHGNGLQTLYAHFSSFSVQNGAYVSRGQQIGWEGSTGWSTGPHVHFEVILNGVKQNPWNWL